MIVSDRPQDMADGLGARTGLKFTPHFTCIGSINKTGEIEAVMLFQSWTSNNIEISVAATNLPRALLHAAFKYVVGQLHCSRATFRTREDNERAVACLYRSGARLEGRMRRYYPDGSAALVFGILKEEYTYG